MAKPRHTRPDVLAAAVIAMRNGKVAFRQFCTRRRLRRHEMGRAMAQTLPEQEWRELLAALRQ
jgi:hypothetical protein